MTVMPRFHPVGFDGDARRARMREGGIFAVLL